MTEDPTTLIEVPVTDSAPWVQFSASEGFSDWLVRHNCSLAFTTYQAGKLFFIGHRSSNQLSIFERTFNRCMGLCVDGQSLWMSSHFQLWRFENVLNSDETYEGYDRLYIPRTAFTTGDLDIHDVAVDRERNPVFVNTRFGCLATLSDRHSFKPLWIPPHLTELVAEDRCHLNGLAMENGQPRFVTLVSLSNQVDQWRNHRVQGGCLLEIPSGRVRLSGLTMPHSPRIYQNRIWLHNSGCGEFGYLDESTESFRPIAFCPGYLRGLAFVENFAVAGVSLPRHDRAFTGLPLEQQLSFRNLTSRCGIVIIDLSTGTIVEHLWMTGEVRELYDVVVLPGCLRPMALGMVSDEIQKILTAEILDEFLTKRNVTSPRTE